MPDEIQDGLVESTSLSADSNLFLLYLPNPFEHVNN
jgi:hypothetical protein